jgi:hypothetical protein
MVGGVVMSMGCKLEHAGAVVVLAAALCLGTAIAADSAAPQTHHKTTKKQPPQLPPLPSGPTGQAVPPIPLDSMAPVPPQVSYQNDQLTIVAPNSTLGDILRAVRKQTGAEIEVPAAPERVVTRLGPGPAREVMAELLNGSRFNYVLLGSPANDGVLTRVVLVVKTGPDNANLANGASIAEQRPPGNMPPNAGQAQEAGAAEVQAADDNTDDAADQAAAEAEAEQQQQQQQAAQPPEQPQPGVKTPQELLQEMQQRQLQFQQQQNPAQPPVPGQGPPPQRQPPQDQQ